MHGGRGSSLLDGMHGPTYPQGAVQWCGAIYSCAVSLNRTFTVHSFTTNRTEPSVHATHIYYNSTRTTPTYSAAWMSGPLEYRYIYISIIAQTFASSTGAACSDRGYRPSTVMFKGRKATFGFFTKVIIHVFRANPAHPVIHLRVPYAPYPSRVQSFVV